MLEIKIGFTSKDLDITHPTGTGLFRISKEELSGEKSKRVTIEAIDGATMKTICIPGKLVYYADMTTYWQGEFRTTVYGKIPAENGFLLDSFSNSNNKRLTYFVPDSFNANKLTVLHGPVQGGILIANAKRCDIVNPLLKSKGGWNLPYVEQCNALINLFIDVGLPDHPVCQDLIAFRKGKLNDYNLRQGYHLTCGRTKWHFVIENDSVRFVSERGFPVDLHKSKEVKTVSSVAEFISTIATESDFEGRDPEAVMAQVTKRIDFILSEYSMDKYNVI